MSAVRQYTYCLCTRRKRRALRVNRVFRAVLRDGGPGGGGGVGLGSKRDDVVERFAWEWPSYNTCLFCVSTVRMYRVLRVCECRRVIKPVVII